MLKIVLTISYHLNYLIIDRERPGPLCEGPPHYGGCKPLSYGFTFDIVSKTCKKVAISGCGRTNNAFSKLEECEKKCSKYNLLDSLNI